MKIAEGSTVYLDRTLEVLRKRDEPISDDLIRHLSPLGWEHINFTGDYVWNLNRHIA